MGRLWQVVKGATDTRFLYDGDALVAEYDGTGNLTARYVHGNNAAADDPLVWYQKSGSSWSTRWLHADHQGSVVAATNGAGGSPLINTYEEYGIPGIANDGRFQYTGQAWLAELGMYYYKARIYSPTLGRFLQTDPIGYDDQINLYAYVGNDPVNGRDPSGMKCIDDEIGDDGNCAEGWDVTGSKDNPAEPPLVSLQLGTIGSPSARPPKDGRGCNQAFLNFFNGLQDFGEATDRAGDATLVVAGALALTGALTTSTVVGAPVGLTAEGLAGGTAALGLAAKTVGGGLKLIGDIGAAVETGTRGSTTGALIARAIIGAIPFNDDAVGAAAGAAGESRLPKTNIPRTCR